MFTGIVEELGSVRSHEGARLTVACRTVAGDSGIGASVAVNGTCLTVVEREDGALAFDLSEETIARTSLGGLAPGDPVNLERPATRGTRLGGHLVQGHVDGVGLVGSTEVDDSGGAKLSVRLPEELMRYVVEKGSITLDGVSLTVASRDGQDVTVALIPHTLAVTTLGAVRPEDPVNVEIDVVAKYVERLVGGNR
jgi:riboflavin synthase